MNVYDYLLEGKDPDAPALLTLNGQYSYGDIRLAADRVAGQLLQSGVKKGARAILLAENGLFWVAVYLGVLRAGLVCVPLPPKLSVEELNYIFGATEPAFVFAQARVSSMLAKNARGIRLVTEVTPGWNDAGAAQQPALGGHGRDSIAPEAGGNDLASLMFTSGSTGSPRGVMISHANIIANTDSIVEYLRLASKDRVMAVLPFHYCFGTSLLHTHLRVGGSLVIEPRFMYPEVVLQRMQETECTGFAGVPSHFHILLRNSRFARMKFPHLRYLQQAGGPLAPAFLPELRHAAPDKEIFVNYGQTEATARLSYLPPELLETKPGSVGKGIPGVRLRVLSPEGRPVVPGEVGEIVAEGLNIGLGYWRDEVESAHSFRNGKLFTGDLATTDEDGFIYIVDRAKDFLKCGGKRVSCRQLENVLLEHPSLLDAAVVGEPDDVLGEAAVAYVVMRDPKADPSPDQLRLHCREHLTPPLVPKRFIFLNSLPKNSSGKVLKNELRTQHANS